MDLTQEDRDAIALSIKEAVAALKPTEIDRTFTPGDPPDVTVGIDRLVTDPKGGFSSFGEFALDVYKSAGSHGMLSERLSQWNSAVKTAGHMEEGDMGQGGYLVPEEFRATLLMVALEQSIVAQRALHIPMATNRLGIPAVVDSTHAAGAYFGGVTIHRPGEAVAKTPSKPAIGKVNLTLHKLTGLVYVSDELLEDSPISLEPVIGAMFSQAIAFVQDDDFLNGNGANKALGAFNAANPSLVAQAKETGQTATTIVFENIVNMWSRVFSRCMANAIWVANNECFPQLAMMNMAVGTGGVPVWMPAGGISGLPFATLMGRPLILSEKMQALGTQGDIGIADFSQYLIGDKGGVKTATSIHIKFVEDEVAFRFVLRYDGQPWWLSTLTPRRGSATLSPFVVLAVRA